MTRFTHLGTATLALALALICPAPSRSFQISGGADGRLTYHDGEAKGVVDGLFFNARHVIQYRSIDRLALVGQLDLDDNFKKLRSYRTYAQFKGDLGRWNLRAGHYILPFGLLAYHDSERLLLQTMELTSLGIKLDTGIEVLGFFGPWDYAASVSQGVGQRRLRDLDSNKLVVGRFGYTLDESRVGLSALFGKVLPSEEIEPDLSSRRETRLATDASHSWGPLVARGEIVFGTRNGEPVGGAFLGADWAVTSRLEANAKYGYWQADTSSHSPGVGLTYQTPIKGVSLRIADEQEFGDRLANTLSGQIYYEFSKSLF